MGMVVWEIDYLMYADEFAASTFVDPAPYRRLNSWREFYGLAAYVILAVVHIVTMMIWVYRANHNVRCLGATELEYEPKWAVASFFVPVVNLWWPFQAVSEIWRAALDPDKQQSVPTPYLLRIWWFFTVAIAFVSLLASIYPDDYWGLKSIIFEEKWSLALMAVELISILLFLKLAKGIDENILAQYVATAKHLGIHPEWDQKVDGNVEISK